MEHVFKQLQHRRPRLVVGLRIVLEGIHPRLAGIRIRESVFDARIGDHVDPIALKERLFDEFRIEAPLLVWNGQPFIRVSFAAFNTEADSDAVVAALKSVLH